MSYEYLILAGLCEAIREMDSFGVRDSWIHRVPLIRKWSETNVKILFWPLDLYHMAKIATVVFLCRAFVGWWDALIGATIMLSVFTFGFEFAFRLVPFRRLKDWFRKLLIPKEDYFIE